MNKKNETLLFHFKIEISKDVTNSKNSSLTIKHPLHTDAGVYMCVMNLEKDPTNSDVIVVRKWTNVWSMFYFMFVLGFIWRPRGGRGRGRGEVRGDE